MSFTAVALFSLSDFFWKHIRSALLAGNSLPRVKPGTDVVSNAKEDPLPVLLGRWAKPLFILLSFLMLRIFFLRNQNKKKMTKEIDNNKYTTFTRTGNLISYYLQDEKIITVMKFKRLRNLIRKGAKIYNNVYYLEYNIGVRVLVYFLLFSKTNKKMVSGREYPQNPPPLTLLSY